MATETKVSRQKRIATGPYHVAKSGPKEAWAYNESDKSISLYLRTGCLTQYIRIRKETLRRLAELR